MSLESRKLLHTPETDSYRVLHIDDDSDFLEVTELYLSREIDQIKITTTTDVGEAIESLESTRYDCVISDYDMPERNGLELLDRVREYNPDLPFLLYTGKGSETIARKAINAGVTGYFQKGGPEQQQRLANRVEHAIEEYHEKLDSERYATVLKALEYPTYVVDANGRFAYLNEAFAELTGYEREALIQRRPGGVKSDQSVERADEALRSVVSSDGPDTERFEIEIETADGEVIPCQDHIAPLPFDDEYRGCAGIMRDISLQQVRRQELERKNERLEEFVSVVSHDLQTPLDTAMTAAELARDSDVAFDHLNDALDRLQRLLDELLAIAQEEETAAQITDSNLDCVTNQAWKSVSADAATLIVKDDCLISADQSRLRRLLENLFKNAIQHGGEDVTVTVGRIDREDVDGFYVADDGDGMSEEVRESVFEPGFTTAQGGTGFGCAIVDRIAAAHDWEIQLTESVGGGARFEFTDAETNGV
jgi:PAS domain S-box-containing protein